MSLGRDTKVMFSNGGGSWAIQIKHKGGHYNLLKQKSLKN